MADKGVASIGECMLELSSRGDGDWRMGFAGDTFNTLWALRALMPGGLPADYISAFGDDPFSRDQIAFFAAHGIGVAASPRIPGARPGLYAITLTGAERAFTYWRADSAARPRNPIGRAPPITSRGALRERCARAPREEARRAPGKQPSRTTREPFARHTEEAGSSAR